MKRREICDVCNIDMESVDHGTCRLTEAVRELTRKVSDIHGGMILIAILLWLLMMAIIMISVSGHGATGTVRNVAPSVESVEMDIENGTVNMVVVVFDANGESDIESCVVQLADNRSYNLTLYEDKPDDGFATATVGFPISNGTCRMIIIVTDDNNVSDVEERTFKIDGDSITEMFGERNDVTSESVDYVAGFVVIIIVIGVCMALFMAVAYLEKRR